MRHPAAASRMIVVIPTYNEAENIRLILDRLRAAQPTFDVLVVDDGSPDGTGGIADEYARSDASVHVLHRTVKEGLGAAYLEGFGWALDKGYDVIGEMDADGSHQPEQLHRLVEALPGADLVIGSRYVPGGSVVNWPKRRQWLSKGGNAYIRALLGVRIGDVTAGYRLFHRDTLLAIDLSNVESTGYVFQADLAYRTLQAGLKVREVPIEFIERERGKSKMSADVARESLVRITEWGVAQRRARRTEARRQGNTGTTSGR